MRSTKIIKIRRSSLCTCLHHMVILRTRNKITDFLMILAWASPFNKKSRETEETPREPRVLTILLKLLLQFPASNDKKNISIHEK